MFSSNQISAMMAQQQGMFTNMQAQSGNMSAMIGQPMPPMQTVPFNYGGVADPYGSQSADRWGVAGVGSTMAVAGGVATAAGLAGGFGLMGHAGGLADPFTGVLRGFGAGGRAASGITAGAGSFMGGGFSGMQAAYQAGNLGKFALGGLGGAAAAALPYYAIGKAASYVGSNMMAGAQQDYAIRQMARQTFDHYNPNARSGRGFNNQQMDTISDTIRGMSREDPFADGGELTRIMAKAGQAGMLRGTTDVQEVVRKFKTLTSVLKDTAKLLGTSMEDAMSFVDASKQMGFYNKVDIMRNVVNATTGAGGGLSSRGIMRAQAQGAQMSYAQGGTLASGARLAGKTIQGVRDMFMGGMMSEQDLRELSGGQTGQAAYATIGRQMQGAAYSLAQSGVGRALYAGLGQIQEGKFTGKLDQGVLKQFLSGQMTAGDVRKRAGRLMGSGLETKASFLNMEKELASEFASQAGPQGWMGVIDIVKKMRPGLGGEATKLLFRNLTGMGRRQVEYIMKLYEKQDELNYKKIVRTTDLLRKRAERADMAANYTFEGIKRKITQAVANVTSEPLKEAGVGLSRWWRDLKQGWSDKFLGRQQTARLSQGTADRLYEATTGGSARLSGILANEGVMAGISGPGMQIGGGLLDQRGDQLMAGMGGRGMMSLASGTGTSVTTGRGGLMGLLGRGLAGAASGAVGLGLAGSALGPVGTVGGAVLGGLVGGIGGMFSGAGETDQYDTGKLAGMQDIFAKAAARSDKFFQQHAEGISAVSNAMGAIGSRRLAEISSMTAKGGQSAAFRRVTALQDELKKDRMLFKEGTHAGRMLSETKTRIANRLGIPADDPKVERLAMQSIIGHSRSGAMEGVLGMSDDPVAKLMMDPTSMDAAAIATQREKEEEQFGAQLQSRLGGMGGVGGALVGGVGGALLGGAAGVGFALAGAKIGAMIGTAAGPIGTVAGGLIGAGLGAIAGIFIGGGMGAKESSKFQDLAKDPTKREELVKMLTDENYRKSAYGKYKRGSAMRDALDQISKMSEGDRKALAGQANRIGALDFAEGFKVMAQQRGIAGRGLMGITQAQFEKAGLGGLGTMIGGLADTMTGLAGVKGGFGAQISAYKTSREQEMAVSKKIAELNERGKGGQVRALLRQAGVGGARLLAGAGVFGRKERGRLSTAMTDAKDFKQFTAALENMGYKISDSMKKSVERSYLSGDVDDLQKSLYMKKTQQGPTTAVGLLTKLNGTLTRLETLGKTQIDAILAVGLKDKGMIDKVKKDYNIRNKKA